MAPTNRKMTEIKNGVGLFKSKLGLFMQRMQMIQLDDLCAYICMKNWLRHYGKEENHHK